MRHLTKEQLLFELHRYPGLVPVAIEIRTRQLEWLDLETYHFYEGFFHKGLDGFAALKRVRSEQSSERFATDLDVLGDQRILVDSIYPTGFIFHAGRCGSTLLTRILARDRRHLVIGEAEAHNQVWRALTNDGGAALNSSDEKQQIYKHLLLAMGRKRLPRHEAYFIKFTSFNILFFNFIRSIFPEVPALFLYREPLDMLASYAKAPPRWLDSKQQTFRRLLVKTSPDGREAENALDAPADAVAAFFTAGLRAGENGARYLNYAELNPANLPAILSFLNVSATTKQLTTMESQFRFDSKVDHGATAFVGSAKRQETPSIEECASGKLRQLYDELAQADCNVVVSHGTTA